MILPGASIVQMAWVVRDLEEAARRFSTTLGVGPFLVYRHIELTEPLYRGLPARTDFSLALAQAGDVQIELVQQHDDTPSIYRDLVAPDREGFHHVAVIVPELAREVERYRALGFAVASEGRFGPVEFAYIDTSPATGHMVELLQDHENIRRFFGGVRKAAQGWDRVDPIRETAPARQTG
jgi:hypothetical protein